MIVYLFVSFNFRREKISRDDYSSKLLCLLQYPSISLTLTEMNGLKNDVVPAIDRQLADIKIRLIFFVIKKYVLVIFSPLFPL